MSREHYSGLFREHYLCLAIVEFYIVAVRGYLESMDLIAVVTAASVVPVDLSMFRSGCLTE